MKGIVQPFGRGVESILIRSLLLNWRPGKFKIFFYDTVSREEHKTNVSGLRIYEMTLSNQSHFPGFFSPRKVNL